jgi:hypothetical protein
VILSKKRQPSLRMIKRKLYLRNKKRTQSRRDLMRLLKMVRAILILFVKKYSTLVLLGRLGKRPKSTIWR